jgi:hypothetical protein
MRPRVPSSALQNKQTNKANIRQTFAFGDMEDRTGRPGWWYTPISETKYENKGAVGVAQVVEHLCEP